MPVVPDVINNSVFDRDRTYYAKVAEDISLKFQDQQVELKTRVISAMESKSIISVLKFSLLCNPLCRTG